MKNHRYGRHHKELGIIEGETSAKTAGRSFACNRPSTFEQNGTVGKVAVLEEKMFGLAMLPWNNVVDA